MYPRGCCSHTRRSDLFARWTRSVDGRCATVRPHAYERSAFPAVEPRRAHPPLRARTRRARSRAGHGVRRRRRRGAHRGPRAHPLDEGTGRRSVRRSACGGGGRRRAGRAGDGGPAAAARRPDHDQGTDRGRGHAAQRRLPAPPQAARAPRTRRSWRGCARPARSCSASGTRPGPYYWLETNNKIYGRTSNAYDPTRTAGGSSGGDGAMVGSGGAAFALGSDMGGSIRMPAFVNGIFGHLPSPGLVPITGHFPMPAGEFRRTLFVGPLTRRAEDLMPVLRIIAGPDGEDPNTEPMPLGDPASVGVARDCACSSPDHSSRCRCARRCAARWSRRWPGWRTPARTCVEVELNELRFGLAQFAAVALSEMDLFASWSDMAAPTEDGRHLPGRDHAAGPVAAADRTRAGARRAPRGARRLADAARRARRTSWPRRSATAYCSTRRSRGWPRSTARRSRSRGSRRTPRSSTCSGCR